MPRPLAVLGTGRNASRSRTKELICCCNCVTVEVPFGSFGNLLFVHGSLRQSVVDNLLSSLNPFLGPFDKQLPCFHSETRSALVLARALLRAA